MSESTGQQRTAGATVYLIEELGDARMRCDQLLRYIEKAVTLVEKSSHKDHFFEVAGDVIRGIPETAFKLHKALEAVALAANRIDYEEIKQDLRPEKVEELERVLKDVRVRQVQRRSVPMLNPGKVVEQLRGLARKAKDEGRLDTEGLGSLIAALETGAPKVAADVGARVGAQLEAMAQALETPPKGQLPSRHRLAQALRTTFAEHVVLASSGEAADISTNKLAVSGLDPAMETTLKSIESRVPGIEAAARNISHSVKTYARDPLKYRPQLDNLGQAIDGLGTIHRVLTRFYEDALKRAEGSRTAADDEKRSRFEEGKPADPTKHMDPEDAKAWKENTDEYGDKFKKEAAKLSEGALLELNTAIYGLKQIARGTGNTKRMLHAIVMSLGKAAEHLGQEGRISEALYRASDFINNSFSVADMREYSDEKEKEVTAAEDEKRSRFEEGKPADPTKHMDPEDAKAWKENTDEYGDKFKKEASKVEVKTPDLDTVKAVGRSSGHFGDEYYVVLPNGIKSTINQRSHGKNLEQAFRYKLRNDFDIPTPRVEKLLQQLGTSKSASMQIPPAPGNVIDEIMSWHHGQGSKLYSVGSRWYAGRSVDAEDAEEAYDELEGKADHQALADFEAHLKEHGVTPEGVKSRYEAMAKRELKEMEALLKKQGFNPKDAKKLQDEGMGPEELKTRLRKPAGEMGSLEYTHNLQRKTKKASPTDAAAWKAA